MKLGGVGLDALTNRDALAALEEGPVARALARRLADGHANRRGLGARLDARRAAVVPHLPVRAGALRRWRGHERLELGCVELFNRKLTGNDLHIYFNPERESHEDALKVHGLTTDFLRDKPRFADVVDEFLAFIRGAELVIHNAAFDIGFLNAELARLGPQYGRIDDHASGDRKSVV